MFVYLMITNPLWQRVSKKFTRVSVLGNKRTYLNIQILIQVAKFPVIEQFKIRHVCIPVPLAFLVLHSGSILM